MEGKNYKYLIINGLWNDKQAPYQMTGDEHSPAYFDETFEVEVLGMSQEGRHGIYCI